MTSTAPQAVDCSLEPRWIIPVEPSAVVLEDHALIVDQGKILDLLPVSDARLRYKARTERKLGEHVLLPGLINLHTHAAMSLLRGYADDLPLMRWLEERIWPAEARHVSAEFVHDGTLLAAAEMLRGGITCFNDMYFYPEAIAKASLRAGMRAAIGITVIEFPTGYASDPTDYLDKGCAARDVFRGEPLISFCLAPHAPYTVADTTFQRVATLAAQLDLQIHVHLHETRHEVEESIKQHGVRPLERLRRLGLLDPRLIAVHAVHFDAQEIELMAANGCSVAHCPTSNMKLASGLAPLGDMLTRSLNVGLGTDGSASNKRLDLFRELRHAALMAKVTTGDASAANAHQVLRMATLGGARALGLEHSIGSLKPGKAADLCAVRLDDWLLQPCYDPASHLVYAAGREHVSDVWVGGKRRVCEGKLLDIEVSELIDIAEMWHNRLR
jgi:5-methylthioadenosine/S-adenosylhomocysteine deaminase